MRGRLTAAAINGLAGWTPITHHRWPFPRVLRLGATVAVLGVIASDPRRMRRALLWGWVNWLLGAASLWCFIASLGRYASPVVLFSAFGIANLVRCWCLPLARRAPAARVPRARAQHHCSGTPDWPPVWWQG